MRLRETRTLTRRVAITWVMRPRAALSYHLMDHVIYNKTR